MADTQRTDCIGCSLAAVRTGRALCRQRAAMLPAPRSLLSGCGQGCWEERCARCSVAWPRVLGGAPRSLLGGLPAPQLWPRVLGGWESRGPPGGPCRVCCPGCPMACLRGITGEAPCSSQEMSPLVQRCSLLPGSSPLGNGVRGGRISQLAPHRPLHRGRGLCLPLTSASCVLVLSDWPLMPRI